MNSQFPIVLILDDDEAIRESFVDFFEDRGWNVLSTGTAEAALGLAAHTRPDGAIVDIRLPGMDGILFICTVSRIYPTMACVICTGSPEYYPPDDVVSLPQVSKKVYTKPVANLIALEETLRGQIKKMSTKCGIL